MQNCIEFTSKDKPIACPNSQFEHMQIFDGLNAFKRLKRGVRKTGLATRHLKEKEKAISNDKIYHRVKLILLHGLLGFQT